jgi:hypothetical protein
LIIGVIDACSVSRATSFSVRSSGNENCREWSCGTARRLILEVAIVLGPDEHIAK